MVIIGKPQKERGLIGTNLPLLSSPTATGPSRHLFTRSSASFSLSTHRLTNSFCLGSRREKGRSGQAQAGRNSSTAEAGRQRKRRIVCALKGASQPPTPRQPPASRSGFVASRLGSVSSSRHRCPTGPPPSGDPPGPAWASWFLRLLVRKLLLV